MRGSRSGGLAVSPLGRHVGDTSSRHWEEVMPWSECSVTDERLQFVADCDTFRKAAHLSCAAGDTCFGR
jgi:hypothetical protein